MRQRETDPDIIWHKLCYGAYGQIINPEDFEDEIAGVDEHTLRTRDEYLATQ